MNPRNDKTSIQLRAQEIIQANPDGMYLRDALKQAILERYKNDSNALAEVAATSLMTGMSGLRKRTYELSDQPGMFEIPSVIGIRTDEGDLLIARESADLDHVRQWQREGQQHHSTQLLRFKRAGDELQGLKEEPGTIPWSAARNMLAPALEDLTDEE
jgi:hypothetical protein